MKLTFKHLCTVLVPVGIAMSGPALGQTDYPTKPIHLVVAFSPGTASDGLARTLGDELSKQLNVPIIVENRVGAGGNIGHASVANAAPDGYTLLMGTSVMAMSVHTVKPKPYDNSNDFAPITRISESPMVALIGKDMSYKTWPEFVAQAKAAPGKMNYITSGKGSSSHILMIQLMKEFGFEAADLPYKNSGQAVVDTASGQGNIFLANIPPARGLLAKGDLRMIATGSAERLREFPDVPTFAELTGKKDYRLSLWYGILAPAGTPAEIVEKLNREISLAASKPSIRERVEASGGVLAIAGPEEFGKQLRSDDSKYGEIIDTLNLSGSN